MNRICFIIPSLQAGGMERVMSELIKVFALKKDYEVHLILYGIEREIFYMIPESVKVHKPYFIFNNNKRIWSTLKTLWFIRKRVNALKPKSILSFGEYWNSFVLIALIGLAFPIFVSDRCQPDKSLGKLHDFLRNFLYKNAKGVIAQTYKAKDIYVNKYKHKNIKVIGNPIRDICSKEKVERENIVLTVGRLIETKHHNKLIEMFARINKPNWKLMIVGDNAQRQNNMLHLQKLVKELGVEDRVFLEGKKSDVDSYYLKSKIFAFTSSSEGFPNVIGEAQSAGLPVIAFDCIAGPSDMIKDGYNGFLIPLFDYNTFESKLNYLMDNNEFITKFGNQARVDVKKFSILTISEKYHSFITNIK